METSTATRISVSFEVTSDQPVNIQLDGVWALNTSEIHGKYYTALLPLGIPSLNEKAPANLTQPINLKWRKIGEHGNNLDYLELDPTTLKTIEFSAQITRIGGLSANIPITFEGNTDLLPSKKYNLKIVYNGNETLTASFLNI